MDYEYENSTVYITTNKSFLFSLVYISLSALLSEFNFRKTRTEKERVESVKFHVRSVSLNFLYVNENTSTDTN